MGRSGQRIGDGQLHCAQDEDGQLYFPQFQIGPIGVCVQHGPKLPPL
ncbi:hypothetical protein RPPS3_28590 [Rhodopseudomonas palustris]|nr:hypothetical protein RPPS3_28590 [Rhodopseudomonas palustris]